MSDSVPLTKACMTTSSSAQDKECSHDLRDARRLSSLQVHDGTNGSRLPTLTFRITEVLSEIDNVSEGS